jgi:hypothetical protein
MVLTCRGEVQAVRTKLERSHSHSMRVERITVFVFWWFGQLGHRGQSVTGAEGAETKLGSVWVENQLREAMSKYVKGDNRTVQKYM